MEPNNNGIPGEISGLGIMKIVTMIKQKKAAFCSQKTCSLVGKYELNWSHEGHIHHFYFFIAERTF